MCVFPLRRLDNCARATKATSERSYPPVPQALRLGELKFRFRRREGEGPVRDGMSRDGVDRCGKDVSGRAIRPATVPSRRMPSRPTTCLPTPSCHDNPCRDNPCRDNACRDNACRDNACRDNACRDSSCRDREADHCVARPTRSPRRRHHHQGQELPDAEAQPAEHRGRFRPGIEDV